MCEIFGGIVAIRSNKWFEMKKQMTQSIGESVLYVLIIFGQQWSPTAQTHENQITV